MSAVDAGSGRNANGAAPAQATPAAGTGRAWAQRYGRAVMNTFGAPQRVLVRGRGARVWDADGAQYTDLLAGIAVNCLGHAHPAVVGAVTAQLSTLGHVSNFFTTPAQITLAEELIGLVFPDADPADSRVFLANSGTEANEAAFKIAGSMAIKKALEQSGPVLLEPIEKVEVETPEQYMGDVMGNLSGRRGKIEGMEDRTNTKMIRAKVPLGEMFGYATDLRSQTQGRDSYTMQFDSYEAVPKNVAEEIISKAGGSAS